MKKWVYDFILGIVVLAVSVAAIAYSYLLEPIRDMLFLARPDTYMALWLGAIAVLAVLLIVRALRDKKTPKGQQVCPKIWTSTPFITAITLFLYLLLLDKVGFILDSTVMLWVLVFVYSMNEKEEGAWKDKKLILRELIKSGIYSVICSVVIYYSFTAFLSAKLPKFNLF